MTNKLSHSFSDAFRMDKPSKCRLLGQNELNDFLLSLLSNEIKSRDKNEQNQSHPPPPQPPPPQPPPPPSQPPPPHPPPPPVSHPPPPQVAPHPASPLSKFPFPFPSTSYLTKSGPYPP